MRIYLDTNVYSLFKSGDFESLRTSVMDDKLNNLYFFSEAHLFDLVRDKTEEKLVDMELIEEVCGRNCYYFDKHIQFNYFSPFEYYKRFDWTPVSDQEELDIMEPFALTLKLFPIRFSDYLDKEKLPDDFPIEFFDLLNESTNLYEFFNGFMDFTQGLSEEQAKFKEFLKYLHKNSLTESIYTQIGLKGYDGNKITDPAAFKDSYLNFCAQHCSEKAIYNVFMQMYNCLEFVGLVKGKPRKQKMMNLINDSRHGYFGSFCDIVVSRDEDFINKCTFLYEALQLDTMVCDVDKFLEIIGDHEKFPSSLEAMLQAIKEMVNGPLQRIDQSETERYVRHLEQFHYGYFDALIYEPGDELNRFTFLKHRSSFSQKAIQPELDFCAISSSMNSGLIIRI